MVTAEYKQVSKLVLTAIWLKVFYGMRRDFYNVSLEANASIFNPQKAAITAQSFMKTQRRCHITLFHETCPFKKGCGLQKMDGNVWLQGGRDGSGELGESRGSWHGGGRE